MYASDIDNLVDEIITNFADITAILSVGKNSAEAAQNYILLTR